MQYLPYIYNLQTSTSTAKHSLVQGNIQMVSSVSASTMRINGCRGAGIAVRVLNMCRSGASLYFRVGMPGNSCPRTNQVRRADSPLDDQGWKQAYAQATKRFTRSE